MKKKQLTKILFTEEQKFRHSWIWLVIFPLLGLLIFFLKINGRDFTAMNERESDEFLAMIVLEICLFLAMTGLTILFHKMRLVTRITSIGVYFKYPPFLNKEKFIPKIEIERFIITSFRPFKEFGGHGYKKGRSNLMNSYTVSGRTGMKIYLTNGKIILFGTLRKEAIKYAMNKMLSHI